MTKGAWGLGLVFLESAMRRRKAMIDMRYPQKLPMNENDIENTLTQKASLAAARHQIDASVNAKTTLTSGGSSHLTVR